MPSLHLDKFYPLSQSQFKYPLFREILPEVHTRGAILSLDPNAPSSSSFYHCPLIWITIPTILYVPLLEFKLNKSRYVNLVCSLLYPQYLEQCLVHSKCSIIFFLNEWMNEWGARFIYLIYCTSLALAQCLALNRHSTNIYWMHTLICFWYCILDPLPKLSTLNIKMYSIFWYTLLPWGVYLWTMTVSSTWDSRPGSSVLPLQLPH